uniref:Uncharacterized protein n=1 Tax=Romanomermis culicivorax TaxID=13658 RepID=A0A915K6A7_ROMCU
MFSLLRLAIEHLITALSLQSSGIGPETANLSSTIWSTFRLAVASLKNSSNQRRLLELVDKKDFPAIKSLLNCS